MKFFKQKNTSQNDVDQALLQRLKAGEQKAVKEWFDLYHDRVLSLVHTKVSIDADAQEITQEVFLACLKHLPLFRGESSIWTWMYRITRHEIADYYRKRYAKKAIKTLSLDDIFVFEKAGDAHETSEKVKLALSHIREDYQELLLLKYVDKKKVLQIAQELDKSVKSVESDLFRARKDFRKAFVALG